MTGSILVLNSCKTAKAVLSKLNSRELSGLASDIISEAGIASILRESDFGWLHQGYG